MDAISLLKEQHEEVESLFTKFERAKSPNSKQAIFNVIADNFAAHSMIEERLFYPAVFVGELRDRKYDAVEEHLAAKKLIAELLNMDKSDPTFDSKVRILHDEIERHVDKEEGTLFPDVLKLFPKRELEAVGEAMEEMFDRLMEGAPRNSLPAELGQSAALS